MIVKAENVMNGIKEKCFGEYSDYYRVYIGHGHRGIVRDIIDYDISHDISDRSIGMEAIRILQKMLILDLDKILIIYLEDDAGYVCKRVEKMVEIFSNIEEGNCDIESWKIFMRNTQPTMSVNEFAVDNSLVHYELQEYRINDISKKPLWVLGICAFNKDKLRSVMVYNNNGLEYVKNYVAGLITGVIKK